MKFKVLTGQWWLFWAAGMVIYPYVIIKGKNYSKRLFRHELQHCYQIEERGVWGFYSQYVIDILKYGYRKHPDEVEAYRIERDPLTEIEESWYKSGEIDLSNRWL